MTYLLDYALQREIGFLFKLRRRLKTYTKQWSKNEHLSIIRHITNHTSLNFEPQ